MAITTAFIFSALITAAISTGISLVVSAFTKPPKTDTGALDFEQTIQRRLRLGEPLHVVVGKRFVSGVAAYDDSYGPRREQGLSVTILSCKPINGVDRITVDGEVVTLDADPTVTEAGVISHFTGTNGAVRLRIRIFKGDDNSGLGAFLNAKVSNFAVTDNFGDYAVLIVDAQNTNDDLDEDSGENNIPFQGYPDVKVEVEGVSVCDPANGGDYEDETTYVYSDNAALIDAQFDFGWYSGVGAGRILAVGNGYPLAVLPIDKITEAEAYCEREGFTCSGVLSSGGSNDQDEIWKCFNGQRVETPSEVYTVPEGARTMTNAYGGVIDLSQFPSAYVTDYDAEGFSTEVYNEVLTTYSEPVQMYGETELPIYSEPAWIATDDHVLRQLSLPLLMVTSALSAAKLQKQEIYLSRGPATASITGLPAGFKGIGVGELVEVVNSNVTGVDRVWIVEGRGQNERLDITLSLREHVPEAFVFDEVTEMPSVNISAPIPRLWADWNYGEPFVNPSTITGLRQGTIGFSDVLIDGLGLVRQTHETQDTQINANAANSGSFAMSVTPSSVFVQVTTPGGTATTPTATATDTNAAGAVTWSWAYVSGSPDINSVGATNGPSISFTASPPDEGSYDAVWRLTASDGVTTVTFDISVFIFGHTEAGLF